MRLDFKHEHGIDVVWNHVHLATGHLFGDLQNIGIKSIKDLKGTDLIVSTTYDFKKKRLPEAENFSVAFRLINSLVTGKYLLVAAVENRQNIVIHYYEYLEGAHYFSSLTNDRFFGLFQPQIKQHILLK